MQAKTKVQKKRLAANVKQQKLNKAGLKAQQNRKFMAKRPPVKKTGGFSASLAEKFFGRSTAPRTAQQSIPYIEMYKDGVCRVSDKLYTKTVMFEDINYQLSQNEDKTQIFEGWCDFLNYFDASLYVQFSFLNRTADAGDFRRAIDIPQRHDAYDGVRREYAEMLQSQLAKGTSGLVRQKYITFGLEAPLLKEVKPRLDRVEADIMANFKTLGVAARPMNGAERLELIRAQLHPADTESRRFDWKALPESGLSTKDFIAPESFDFRDSRTFRMGACHGAASFLQIIAPELNDRLLADFLALDTSLTVTMHIRSIDQSEAIKTVKRKLTDLDRMRIEEQKKAVRSGYDMDIIPTDLATYGKEAQTLLADLQSRNERMFLVTFTIVNMAQNKRKLENDVFQAAGIAQKYNCALKRLDFQQEQGLMSSLPLGRNHVEIIRGLTTSSTAIFVTIDLLGAKCANPKINGSYAICGTYGRAVQQPLLHFIMKKIPRGYHVCNTPIMLIQKGGLRIISTYIVGSISTAIKPKPGTLKITY